MINRTFGLLLLFLLVGQAACETAETAPAPAVTEAPASQPETDEAAPFAPPSYATAIDRNLPQGTVAGVDRVEPLPVALEPDRFSAASDYAANMDSYALLIWHHGALRHAEYFAPHDSTLRPESASMHKSVMALVVGAAITDGLIESVDTPIETYLPEWTGQPRGQITVANLLQMNSGLRPLSYEGGVQSEAMIFAMQGDTVRDTLLSMDLLHEPGTVFHYMSVQSQMLGLILERTTGQPYADYMSQRIWKPIGADDAFVWNNEQTGFPRVQSSLLARAEDWLRIGLLIKDDGVFGGQRLISSDYLDAMTTPSPTNPNYGFQVWLGTEYDPERHYNDAEVGAAVNSSAPYAVDDLVYFDGFGGQRVYVSRKLDLVIFRSGEMRVDWDDAALPNLVIDALE
jgi:CubicO group peptidase (beta-lactamase class C family)